MKTGAYWFKFLTEKEQEEFKGNFNKYYSEDFFDDFLNKPFINFNSFIYCSFNYEKTPQGHNYWHEISQRKVE